MIDTTSPPHLKHWTQTKRQRLEPQPVAWSAGEVSCPGRIRSLPKLVRSKFSLLLLKVYCQNSKQKWLMWSTPPLWDWAEAASPTSWRGAALGATCVGPGIVPRTARRGRRSPNGTSAGKPDGCQHVSTCVNHAMPGLLGVKKNSVGKFGTWESEQNRDLKPKQTRL